MLGRWTCQLSPDERGTARKPEDIGHIRPGSSLAGVRINVVTMFPGFFDGPLGVSIVARGVEAGILEVVLLDLREHGLGRHASAGRCALRRWARDGHDGGALGGCAGAARRHPPRPVHPGGAPLTQSTLDRWAGLPEITFVCGRFEGVDQRVVDNYIDEETSVGDFVLAGGEVAAALAIEGIARLIPGVVGNPGSTESESFRDGLIEEPVHTRPADFRGFEVPEVLLSGNHALIEEWRRGSG